MEHDALGIKLTTQCAVSSSGGNHNLNKRVECTTNGSKQLSKIFTKAMRPRVNVRGVWQRAPRQPAETAEEEKQSITVTSGYSHLNKFQLSGVLLSELPISLGTLFL